MAEETKVPTKITPMMEQYLKFKKEIPADAVLFFRLGDFYEMFFEDAVKASNAMGLVLTKRANVPMCGFPYHALETQLPIILNAGYKVAIAEQIEDPKLATKLVKRAITRIITPGTLVDHSLLSPDLNNFLTALIFHKDIYALASLDISTGEFKATEFDSIEKLATEMNRLGSAECLISCSLKKELSAIGLEESLRHRIIFTELDDYVFNYDDNEELLKKHFEVATLNGFGLKDRPLCVASAGALLQYAETNLRQDISHINKFYYYNSEGFLELDSISQRNLELVEPLFGTDKSNTLLSVIDQTITPMGGRLLRNWLLKPLYDHDKIVARLDGVELLQGDPLTLAELRETISCVRDIERIIARLNIGNANARDLLALGNSLEIIPGVRSLLQFFDVPILTQIYEKSVEFPQLVAKINEAISEDAPVILTDGNIIKNGFNAELDELRAASIDGKKWISSIQAREIERTGIKNLKIKFNNVFGYFIEVSKSNLSLVPDDYIRKQTIANGERFITPELKELENKILGAEEKSKALELKIFQELREFIVGFTPLIQQTAEAVAELDSLMSLAETARKYNYIRPQISDDDVIDIKGGRHPVLDAKLVGETFVPNDVLLDTEYNRMMLITGPNMAGKSTYIRQTALLVILAQMGSFIPAESAKIGLVDRIFTRVGASDDLSRGQSTFMVEMVETANILNHATRKSLVILDEIGRGTSTFDGLSIAWSVAEFLHDDPQSRCRTQFATHYHELTELARIRKGIKNFNVAVKEYGDSIIFLRQIVPGSTDRSYGIHVAKLAGIPECVISRSKEILEILENNSANPQSAVANIRPKAVKSRRKNASNDDDSELFQLRLF
ncbi:MAG: DNA mismatch repair protein MutS [Lentisphaeria bacterium]|nr:DNA mismatch repair protein MutS [Lentisphaeria bacterium]